MARFLLNLRLENQRTNEAQFSDGHGSVIAFLKSDMLIGNMGESLSFGDLGDDETLEDADKAETGGEIVPCDGQEE